MIPEASTRKQGESIVLASRPVKRLESYEDPNVPGKRKMRTSIDHEYWFVTEEQAAIFMAEEDDYYTEIRFYRLESNPVGGAPMLTDLRA